MASDVSAFGDEEQIRGLYQRMLDSWGDAKAYASCFTADADYIIANGDLEHGVEEIVAGHEIIFNGWAQGTRLIGAVHSIRFLVPDIAHVIAYGNVDFEGSGTADDKERTVYSLVAQKLDDEWQFVAYQNTPLTGPGGGPE